MKGKNGWKKRIAVFLALLLLIGLCPISTPEKVQADEPTVVLTVSDSEVQRGDTLTLSMSIPQGKNIEGFAAALTYDAEKLEYVSHSQGIGVTNGFASIHPSTGKVKIAGIGMNMPGGEVMSVQLKVKDNASGFASVGVTEIDFADVVPNTSSVVDSSGNAITGVNITIPLTGITLDQTSLTLEKGGSAVLTASPVPAEASLTDVTWSSSDENVATVQGGNVTATGKGNAVITASCNGLSASCNVIVTNPLKGISLDKSDITLKKGKTEKLSVIYQPEDADVPGSVSWTSSQPDVASVSENGTVTALKDGTATITATVGNFQASCIVRVQEVKLESIGFAQEQMTIHRGDSAVLEINYYPENTTDDRTARWTSSDPTVASVDAGGNVEAHNLGSTIITAEVAGKTASCEILVDAPLQSIETETELNLVKNQKTQITYTLNPSDTTDSRQVTFTSADPEIAQVDETGLVTAIKAGTTEITLAGANSVTAVVTVNVEEIPVEGIVLNYTSAVVEKDEQLQLTAKVYPENTTDDVKITWSSSDENIVTVDENGMVTAVGGGNAVITASDGKGVKAECKILVPIHLTGISLPESALILKGQTITLQPEYEPENTTDDKTITWSSDSPEIAQVNENGMVQGLKEGTAHITATVGSFTATTEIFVQEIHLTGIELKTDLTELLKGQSADMKEYLTYLPENTTDDKTVTWTSSDEDIAVIDANGIVTGLKEGTVEIIATVGKFTDSVEIQIKEIPLESIAFDRVVKTMDIGEKIQLGIIANPENTTDEMKVVWSSSDAEVISVEDGMLTALKAGKATITAAVGDKSVTMEITVNEKKDASDENSEVITPAPGSDNGNKNDGDNNPAGQSNGKDTSKSGDTAKKNAESGVKTGDTTNIALYFILVFAALDLMGILLVIRKRRTNH